MRTMLSRHDTLLAQLACVTRAMRALAAHHVTVERIEIGSTDMPILHIECGGALARDPAKILPNGWATYARGRDARGDWQRSSGRLFGCAVEWEEVRHG